MSQDPLTQLAALVGEGLLSRRLRLATAESCTGGWVAKSITDIPGSSQWFERGFVVYSNKAKQELLAVPPELIAQHGAVSAEVVRAMVEGALKHSQAEVALAITGIAGPGGGSAEKPVGTVWFGWGQRGGPIVTQCHRFNGDRSAIRQQAVEKALAGLIEYLGAHV